MGGLIKRFGFKSRDEANPSSSRRAFLTGRRNSRNPWEAFCQRLRTVAAGSFYEFEQNEGSGSARLVPKQASDVHHARVLCAQYGIQMALDGVPQAAQLDDHPVLWVEPGRDLSRCERLEPGSTKWFVQPGCLLGELEAAGISAFADLPCHISVAAWLADRRLCDFDTGRTSCSGVVHASVLLADGTSVNLGPFGESNTKPLEGARLQSLVPALFQLVGGAHARECMEHERWHARYRLDALSPKAGQEVNLSHLILGHGGDLGWVEWIVLDESLARPEPEPPYARQFSSGRAAAHEVALSASELDAQVKALFDPHGLFPHPGQGV